LKSDNLIKSESDRIGNCCWLNETILIPQQIPHDKNIKTDTQAVLWTHWSVTENVFTDTVALEKPVFDINQRACLVDLERQKAELSASELTSIEFIDVPTGASVHPAENTETGIWAVTAVDVAQIYYCPSPNQSGKCMLTVQLTAQENQHSDPISMVVGVEVDLPLLETASHSALETKPPSKGLSVKQGKVVQRKNSKPAQVIAGQLSAKASVRKPVKRVPVAAAKTSAKPALTARVMPVQKKPQATLRKPVNAGSVAPKRVTAKPKLSRPSVTVKANPIKKVAELTSESKISSLKPGPDILENIVLRLGASPEFGDPYYRIYVDGRQVSSGNIDYSAPLTEKTSEAEIAICWQDIVIPWPSDAATPSKLLVRYDDDQSGPFQQPRNMVVDYAMVAGIKMDPDGPYAFYPTTRRPMGGHLDRIGPMSWDGDLIFNVTGALAGNPNLVIAPDISSDVSNNRISMDKPLEKIAEDRILNIQASNLDIHNPSIMAELCEVRNYLRGNESADQNDNKRKNTLGFLGVDKTRWSDLKVVAPDGSHVSLTAKEGGEDKGQISVADMELGRLVKQRFVERLMNKAMSGAAKNIEAHKNIDRFNAKKVAGVKITTNNDDMIIHSIIDTAQKLSTEFLENAILSAHKMSMAAKLNIGNANFLQKNQTQTIDSGNRLRKNFLTTSLQKTIKALETVASNDSI